MPVTRRPRPVAVHHRAAILAPRACCVSSVSRGQRTPCATDKPTGSSPSSPPTHPSKAGGAGIKGTEHAPAEAGSQLLQILYWTMNQPADSLASVAAAMHNALAAGHCRRHLCNRASMSAGGCAARPSAQAAGIGLAPAHRSQQRVVPCRIRCKTYPRSPQPMHT